MLVELLLELFFVLITIFRPSDLFDVLLDLLDLHRLALHLDTASGNAGVLREHAVALMAATHEHVLSKRFCLQVHNLRLKVIVAVFFQHLDVLVVCCLHIVVELLLLVAGQRVGIGGGFLGKARCGFTSAVTHHLQRYLQCLGNLGIILKILGYNLVSVLVDEVGCVDGIKRVAVLLCGSVGLQLLTLALCPHQDVGLCWHGGHEERVTPVFHLASSVDTAHGLYHRRLVVEVLDIDLVAGLHHHRLTALRGARNLLTFRAKRTFLVHTATSTAAAVDEQYVNLAGVVVVSYLIGILGLALYLVVLAVGKFLDAKLSA